MKIIVILLTTLFIGETYAARSHPCESKQPPSYCKCDSFNPSTFCKPTPYPKREDSSINSCSKADLEELVYGQLELLENGSLSLHLSKSLKEVFDIDDRLLRKATSLNCNSDGECRYTITIN